MVSRLSSVELRTFNPKLERAFGLLPGCPARLPGLAGTLSPRAPRPCSVLAWASTSCTHRRWRKWRVITWPSTADWSVALSRRAGRVKQHTRNAAPRRASLQAGRSTARPPGRSLAAARRQPGGQCSQVQSASKAAWQPGRCARIAGLSELVFAS